MSAIKFRKRITKFKIMIALSIKFGRKGFTSAVKIIKILRSSGELISWDVRRGTSPSRKEQLTIPKSNSSCLSLILVATVQLDIHRFKSKQEDHIAHLSKQICIRAIEVSAKFTAQRFLHIFFYVAMFFLMHHDSWNWIFIEGHPGNTSTKLY